MKILSNLIMCLVFVCAIGCSKDNDTNPTIDNSEGEIYGTWKVIDVTCNDGVYTVTENGVSSGGAFIFHGESINSQIEFRSDQTFEGQGSFTEVYTSLVGPDLITTEQLSFDFVNNGTWTKDENLLTLTHQKDETVEVINLTSLSLQLKFPIDIETYNNNITRRETGSVVYTLKRN